MIDKHCKFLLAVCLFFAWRGISFAQPLSSEELIKKARSYDNKPVVYAGEVIGDIMLRGEYAWINMSDGKNALGVWIKSGLLAGITQTGAYGSRGDWVEVNGVFHRACNEHGGDLDIHAGSINLIAAGKKLRQELNKQKRDIVFILLGVLCLVSILRLIKRPLKAK